MSINIDFSVRGADCLFTTDWTAWMWLLLHLSLSFASYSLYILFLCVHGVCVRVDRE